MQLIQTVQEMLWAFLTDIKITYIIDIVIIAYVFYKLLSLIKETRAEQIVKGFIFILIIAKLSEWLKLYAVHYILQSTFTVGLIALVIIFQPELRKALEHMGSVRWLTGGRGEGKDQEKMIGNIIEASMTLSRRKIGALIVIERQIGINDIIETGTTLDASITPELIMNVFQPKSPLHDGALVIKNNRIMAAGCLLPLSENRFISKELGTRHRAALGMNESSDSLIIVVSEETGAISVALDGELQRFLDSDSLKKIMEDSLSEVTGGVSDE